MLIASDIDNVLLDFINPFILFHNDKYGTRLKYEDIVPYDLTKVLGVDKRTCRVRVIEFLESHYKTLMEPLEGVQEGVRTLKEGNDLIIITGRSKKLRAETRDLINLYFPTYFPHIYHSSEYYNRKDPTKPEICANLKVDILIEDSLEHALECASITPKILPPDPYRINVILLDKPWNQDGTEELPENVVRVYSWQEIPEIVKALSSSLP